MFGQSQSSPFGGGGGGFGSTPAPAPFGQSTFGAAPNPAPAPAFGQSTFGGGGGFGGFGGTPAPTGGFGSTGFGAAPAPTSGFGGFGNTSNTGGAFGSSGGTGFGGGGAFGSTNNTPSPFGTPAPTTGTGLFGSNPTPAPAFGAPAPTGGLFGAPAPAPGGLFGSTPANTGFGSSNTGGFGSTGFGAAPQPAFGQAPAPATGMFGAPAPPPGGIFGSSNQTPMGGVGGGTKQTPYQATSRQDGASSIQMQTISAMSAYEGKSLEELRYEDYLQGNKGSGTGAGTTPGFGGFGTTPAPAPGLFGSPALAPAFGSPPATSPFGAPAPSAFGGGFGSKPATGIFGSAPASTTFGFGGSTPAPAPFGAAPATGGLFGSTPAPAPAFGATAPAPAFGFGAPAPPPAFGTTAPGSSLFGSPAPAPAFGAAPAPAFGFGATPAPAPFGPAPATGGLFGSTPAPAPFGAPAPTTSLFPSFGSTPAPAPGGSFSKPPGTSLFGAPAPPPAMGFGSPSAAQPTGLFGQQPAATSPAFPPAGAVIPQAASEVLAHQIQALENKRKEIQKLDVWRGKSSEGSIVTPVSQPQFDGLLTSSTFGDSPYTPYGKSPRSTARIRPRGFGSTLSPVTTTTTPPLKTVANGGRTIMTPDSYVASSVKRLVIKPGAMTPKPKLRLHLANSPATAGAKSDALPASSEATAGQTHAGAASAEPSPMQSPTPIGTPFSIPVYGRDATPTDGADRAAPPGTPATNGTKSAAPVEKVTPPVDPAMEFYNKVVNAPVAASAAVPSPRTSQPQSSHKKRPAYLPKLTKPGYVVSPSLEEMASMSEAELATLPNFSVRCDPYGVVEWEGEVDVREADLDASIEIGQNDVSVYTRDEEVGRKPPVGTKLNRPAVITFFNVFPKNGGPDSDEETKRKFQTRIERSTTKMGAELISYFLDTGEWKIRVKHFSRYGLDEDDSEEEDTLSPATFQGTPEKVPVEEADPWQDDEESTEEAAVVSDVEMEREGEEEVVMRDAEAAYSSIYDDVNTYKRYTPEEAAMEEGWDTDDEDEFLDAIVPLGSTHASKRLPTSDQNYERAVGTHGSTGISSRVSSKVFARVRRAPSNIDYGMRMGRSFRVGWSPDGSFLKLAGGGTRLQRCRPVLHDPLAVDGTGTKYLEVHKSRSRKVPTPIDDRSPRFVLPITVGSADSAASKDALFSTISSYADQREESDIGSLAFSLLMCLVDDEDSVVGVEGALLSGLDGEEKARLFETRRKEAVLRFFVKACRGQVSANIQAAIKRGDTLSAIAATVAGGDMKKACKLSADMGFDDLGTVVSAGGSADIAEHVRLASVAPSSSKDHLLQIYRLLSGDVNAADVDDWMQAFLVRLLFSKPQSAGAHVPELVKAFNKDAQSMTAPFPSPKYAHGDKSKGECILCRILRLTEIPQALSCSDVIDPSSSSLYEHNFSLAFHLASCMLAGGLCEPLSPSEEARLIDGYCAQLCLVGRWEWAVYVCLCALNPEMLESSSTDWKRCKAKELVLRKFNLEDPDAERKRNFLENSLGIPKEWVMEALALRHGGQGSPADYIGCVAAFSPALVAAVVDQLIVPNLFCMGKNDLKRSLRLLESFECELSPLAKAALNLYALTADLYQLGRREKNLEKLSALADVCQDIENTLQAHRHEGRNKKESMGITFCPSARTIPLESMLQEALDHCNFLKLRLKALEIGMEMSGDMSKKRLTTLLAFHAVDGYSDRLSTTPDIVHALR